MVKKIRCGDMKARNALLKRVEKLRPNIGTAKSSPKFKRWKKQANRLTRLNKRCVGSTLGRRIV